jgi:hypothetical protein
MYNGWLEYAGIELINAARTKKYLTTLLKGLDVRCDTTGLMSARGAASYVSPAADGAPWYKSTRPATARFYGLFPATMRGEEDSSRGVSVIELSGDGATYSKPRYGSREIRISAVAFAADNEAMGEGLAWLRDALDSGECAETTGACSDNDLRMYLAQPKNGSSDNYMLRTFIRTEVLDNVSVTKDWGSKVCVAKTVEFIFTVGVPWAFTPKALVGTLDMGTGTASFTDPTGEDCYSSTNAYTNFINDPYYTGIVQPPAPPNIKPPNVTKPASWQRKTLPVTQSEVDRWGRVAPIVTVATGSGGAALVRVRFYGTGSTLSGCGYEGEFYISYIPPNSTMILDTMRKEITVVRANGAVVPGGQLVYGSDGLPLKWPSLGCSSSYTMTADMLSGQSGISVMLESSVRE